MNRAASKMREVLSAIRSTTQLSIQDVTHYWQHAVSTWQFKNQERLQTVTQSLHREYARRMTLERAAKEDELKSVEQNLRARFEKEFNTQKERNESLQLKLNETINSLRELTTKSEGETLRSEKRARELSDSAEQYRMQMTKLEELRSKLEAERFVSCSLALSPRLTNRSLCLLLW